MKIRIHYWKITQNGINRLDTIEEKVCEFEDISNNIEEPTHMKHREKTKQK